MEGRHRIVSIVPTVSDDSADEMEQVESLAWDNSVMAAEMYGWELGSDKHVELHRILLEHYQNLGRHSAFLQSMSLRCLHALLETRRLALVVNPSSDGEDISEALTELAHVILSTFMWLDATRDYTWLDNDGWSGLSEEAQAIEFPVFIPGVGSDDDR